MARVNEGSHSFICHPHLQMEWAKPVFTPSHTTTEHHHTLASSHFPSMSGWLYINVFCQSEDSYSSLMSPTLLPLCQPAML